ncbi:MAG: hypothetical protein MO853_12570 [Candidatus Protistobacter heckmanni]|nr:hypothetical protein [Candidatus Protistobacter heckmanni]
MAASQHFIPASTAVDIRLDGAARLLVTPTIPESWRGLLEYRIVGGGVCHLLPAHGARYQLGNTGDAPGSRWIVDTQRLDADALRIRVDDAGAPEWTIGGVAITWRDGADAAGVTLLGKDGREWRMDAARGERRLAGIDLSRIGGCGNATETIPALCAQLGAGADPFLRLSGLLDAAGNPFAA